MKINKNEKYEIANNLSIDAYSRNVALILLVLGVIHLISPRLDMYWGILLIATGAFSFFVRKKSTILVVGAVLVLAGIFNGLSLWLGYVDKSDVGWALFGIFQVYLGLTEFVKYYKIRKVKFDIKTNKLFEIIGYVVLVLVFVFYVYMSWFYVPEDTLIKDINGEQIEIPASECVDPYEEVWDRCCIINQNYSWLCDDEGVDYETKLALVDAPTTNQMAYDEILGLSFEYPEGYYLVRDTEEGGIKIPYVFVAGIGNDSADGSVYITIMDFRSWNHTSEDWTAIFLSLQEDFLDYDELNDSAQNAKGHEILTMGFANHNPESNTVTYTKEVVFKNYGLLIRFEGIDQGKDYVHEFDRMIASMEFDN